MASMSLRFGQQVGKMAVGLLGLVLGCAAAPQGLPSVTPETVGLSSSRLERVATYIEGEIAAGRKVGAVVLVARHGKVAYFKAFGEADRANHRPMPTDAYFRLQSMTKPVTSVALLTLLEQGKFLLDDPLSKYLPEFKEMQVYRGSGPHGEILTEPAARPITIRDVMRHTAGFTYGYFGDTAVDHAYREAGLGYEAKLSLKDFVAKLATLPLLYQPGTRWHYGFAHDVQARLVEVLSGMPFDVYCARTILEPLGMRDTVFGIPPERSARFASIYHPLPDGSLQPGELPTEWDYAGFTGHPYGGAGLSSTPADYLRFAQMLLNGGELSGVRILGRKTVELMRHDALGSGIAPMSPGSGYGLGVGVTTDAAATGAPGSDGTFYWGGYATTMVDMDPKEDLVTLAFTQVQPGDMEFRSRIHNLVYQAIAD